MMFKKCISELIANWNINDIFSWSEVKRAQFIVLFSGLLAPYTVAVIWTVIGLGFDVKSLNLEVIQQMYIPAIGYLSASLCLFFLGYFFKDTSPKMQLSFVFLCLMLYSIGNVIALYYSGVFSIVGGVAMAGGSVVGLLLFDWRPVLLTFFLAILASIALFIMSVLKLIPYAALVNSESPLLVNYAWFIIVSALVTPQVISILYIAFVSVKAWRLREETIFHLSQTDELTQLSNRRVLIEMLNKNIKSAKKSLQPLSLLILDLDYFKNINDKHGHQVGDIAIKAVAQLMRESFYKESCLARYGGEEFCIILENTPSEIAFEKAEALRRRIELYKITQVPDMSLSASIGLFTWEVRNNAKTSFDQLLEAADRALYQAKADGRNCVRVGELHSS